MADIIPFPEARIRERAVHIATAQLLRESMRSLDREMTRNGELLDPAALERMSILQTMYRDRLEAADRLALVNWNEDPGDVGA